MMLAHVNQLSTGVWDEHALDEHLCKVAKLAAEFAGEFGSADWAYVAGVWHDLGKYRPAFQSYIKKASGYDPEAHLEGQPGRVEHSAAGAMHALKRFKQAMGQDTYGRILAYMIAGHHAGLGDWESREAGKGALALRMLRTEQLDELASQPIPDAILTTPLPNSRAPAGADPSLWIRMLFSCLVDADFLDTERFMQPDKPKLRGDYPSLAALQQELDQYMQGLAAKAEPSLVNDLRAQMLAQCRAAASQPPGLFSLAMPTGGGKTLASLAFALNHALQHGKRRIIYVIPFTSIIEQTADVFRAIGPTFAEATVEHHSNFEHERETTKSRLATENWDAPIIVTTAVQFFESLFAARTSRVRKLHNIVNSVVIFDEAQTLPCDFLIPILKTLQQLSDVYDVTQVLCTATQPTLDKKPLASMRFPALKNVREIITQPATFYAQLSRVALEVRDLQQPVTWDALSDELAEYPQVLCVVDRRADCQALFRKLPDEHRYHLSTFMCGQHRSEVIAVIRQRLKDHLPVRVISTQLIEAGVDLDFPVVYRASAGLDSIAQAAGRCNREGRLLGKGRVVVFQPPQPAPAGHLRQAQDIGRMMLNQYGEAALAFEHFPEYFQRLYYDKGDAALDKHNILDDLKPHGLLEFRFRQAAHKFKLIDDVGQSVIVPHGEAGQALIEQLKYRLDRQLMRQLQRYTVSVPENMYQVLLQEQALQEVQPNMWVLDTAFYNVALGVVTDKPVYELIQ